MVCYLHPGFGGGPQVVSPKKEPPGSNRAVPYKQQQVEGN